MQSGSGKCVSESFSIELDWPHLSVVSLAIEGGKTLCNRVEVTRGAAKWITSELFAAGHIRRWTINLRGFHFISFCIHRATTCKWHRKCSKCTCQLSALTVHISIIQLLKSNPRTDPHRISIERERSARNERYSKSPIQKPKWETRNHFKVIDTRPTHTHTRTHTQWVPLTAACFSSCCVFFLFGKHFTFSFHSTRCKWKILFAPTRHCPEHSYSIFPVSLPQVGVVAGSNLGGGGRIWP